MFMFILYIICLFVCLFLIASAPHLPTVWWEIFQDGFIVRVWWAISWNLCLHGLIFVELTETLGWNAYAIHCYLSWLKKLHFPDENLQYFPCLSSKHRFASPLESPSRGGSNVYPQSMFEDKKKKMFIPANATFPWMKLAMVGFSEHGLVNVTVAFLRSRPRYSFNVTSISIYP